MLKGKWVLLMASGVVYVDRVITTAGAEEWATRVWFVGGEGAASGRHEYPCTNPTRGLRVLRPRPFVPGRRLIPQCDPRKPRTVAPPPSSAA